ncbi:hypothetical protein GOODEAATRI_034593 [Goodea atripinnis]|uniref:Uncharacterized protein n=1 Tax=Goodea atripinnis TaxID=208336 RepID=A0ABV0Q3H0_9TELE
MIYHLHEQTGICQTSFVYEFKLKFNMEDSPPVSSNHSSLAAPINSRSAFLLSQSSPRASLLKKHLHGRHRSSAELRPTSTPSPPQAPNSFHTKAYATTRIGSQGEDVPNHKMFIQTPFILSIHVFLRGPSAKEIIFH